MIEVVSPAKINLSLNIKGLRPDGYHELETVMATIGLVDTIRMQQSSALQVSVTGLKVDCEEKDNLAYKAAKLFFKASKTPIADQNLLIEIQKTIPSGGGLAGGSSNAIATLIGLNHLFKKVLPFETMLKLAQELGSDTAFFLYGNQCNCTGRGEVVTPLSNNLAFAGDQVFLFLPNIHISTGKVFTEWRKDNVVKPAKILENDLEKTVWKLYPVMQEKFENLKKSYPSRCMMSGSGSTYFVIGKDSEKSTLQRYAESIDCQMIPTIFTETPCYVK